LRGLNTEFYNNNLPVMHMTFTGNFVIIHNERLLSVILSPVVAVMMAVMTPVSFLARPQTFDEFFQFNRMKYNQRQTDADGQFFQCERLCFKNIVHKWQVNYCHLQCKCSQHGNNQRTIAENSLFVQIRSSRYHLFQFILL